MRLAWLSIAVSALPRRCIDGFDSGGTKEYTFVGTQHACTYRRMS